MDAMLMKMIAFGELLADVAGTKDDLKTVAFLTLLKERAGLVTVDVKLNMTDL